MRIALLALVLSSLALPVAAQTWRFETDRDQFTDERRARAVYQSRSISAAVRCHDGALDALFIVSYIGEEDATVRYRIDRGEVRSNVWDAGTSRDSLFAWDPGDVARQMMAGSTMAFEHDDFSGTPHRYTISLAGSGAAIGRVLDACDVPRTDPRKIDSAIWVRAVDDLDKAPRSLLEPLQGVLAGSGFEVAQDGRRSQATYKALSDFYSLYWRGCEAGGEAGASCTSWRASRRYDADADYPKEPIALLAEFTEESAARVERDAAAPLPVGSGAAEPSSAITDVEWTLPPRTTSGDYPQRAIDRALSGSATIECSATSSGRPLGCQVISESPSGMGFGSAALLVVQRAQLSPATADKARNGNTFRVVVPFPASTN